MAYTITQKENYLHIDWHGVFSSEDLASIRQALPEWAEKLKYAPNVLHTFEKLSLGDFKPIEAFDHALLRKSTRLPNRAKSASVAKTEEVYKIASLFVELNRNPNIDMQIFRSKKEALAWLQA